MRRAAAIAWSAHYIPQQRSVVLHEAAWCGMERSGCMTYRLSHNGSLGFEGSPRHDHGTTLIANGLCQVTRDDSDGRQLAMSDGVERI